MRIERIFYGMIKGKIIFDKTSGVNSLLSDSQIEHIRKLTVADSDRYLIFNKNIIAIPKIIMVFDEKSKRSWVQNETRIMTLTDYLEATNPLKVMFNGSELTEIKELPDQFNPISV